ncbi:MAG: sulfite exporter TauE/SafE family protein [Armatimonadota bacterium]
MEETLARKWIGRRIPEASKRHIRWVLIGFWVLSVIALIATAAFLAVAGGGPVREPVGHRHWSEYWLPASLSFMSQYVDASLGMGYGTTLTALLIILGYPATQVVVAVLLQQLVAGGIASISHHVVGNADLTPGTPQFHLATLLGGVAIIGSFVAATVAVSIPQGILDTAIGSIIMIMGLVVLAARRLRFSFSWWRAGVLGLIAAANKGFMGGGYGPLIVAGQLVTGDGIRQAVAVTAMSEALSCIGGVVGYAVMGAAIPWMLTLALLTGGAVASVFAAATVRSLPPVGLKRVVAGTYLVLGALTLYAGIFGG